MEKELESWFCHQYPDLQPAHLNFSSGGLNFGQQSSGPVYMTPHSNEVPVKENSPYSFSGLPESKASQPTEHNSWFYCLPQFRQGFAPVSSTVVKEKLAPQSVTNLGEANAGPGSDQKRFLVFDQSGDQTTLIYSSSNATPVQCLPSWGSKSPPPCNLIREGPNIKRNGIFPFGKNHLGDEYYEEDHRDDVESEMHEDTEELNALLYSDDDIDYSEDAEETSTGHSPSTMTAHDLPQWFGETGEEEEVASSAWPTKRLKRLDGGPSLMDTAISAKPLTCSDLEDDAESSCGNNENQLSEASVVSLSGKKRPRKDDIRETISILQTIIPGGEGKDPTVVIDEAISYLRSLKVKAKALGLDTL